MIVMILFIVEVVLLLIKNLYFIGIITLILALILQGLDP